MSAVYGNLGKEVMEKAYTQQKAEMKRQQQKRRESMVENKKQAKSKQDDGKQVTFADGIVDQDIYVDPKVVERFTCTCPICQLRKKSVGTDVSKAKLDIDQKKGQEKDANERNFSFLLKSFLTDRGTIAKGFKFLIADTLIYMNGEPKILVYNSGDKLVRFMKSKDSMTLTDMRKFFQERRRRKDALGYSMFYENNITIRKQIEESSNRNPEQNEGTNSVQFDTQDRMNKGIRSKRVMEESTAHKDCMLIRFKDDAIQVLSELEFSYFMMKRKIEPIWKEIDYMQIYTRMKRDHSYLIKVEYKHSVDRHKKLYDDAARYIYYMQEDREIDIDGFSQATKEDYYEDQLKKSNYYEYCQYLTYKFVCYLDAYCKIRVKEMIAEFAWEESDLVYLVNAYRIFFYNLSQVTDYTLKLVDMITPEDRINYMEKIQISPYKGKLQFISAFQEYREERYKQLKDEMNGMQEDSMLEYQESDEAFKKMNPEVSFTLNEVLTNDDQFSKFSQWLLQRGDMIGDQATMYKSALRYAEQSRVFEKIGSQPLKKSKSQFTIKTQKGMKAIPTTYDSKKNFSKKLKALDICGNGTSNKKYINSSEVNYHKDLYELKKLKSPSSVPKLTTIQFQNSTFDPQYSNDKLSMSGATATEFRSVSGKSTRPVTASTNPNVNASKKVSRMVSMKQKSLTSVIYMKPQSGQQVPNWNAPNFY